MSASGDAAPATRSTFAPTVLIGLAGAGLASVGATRSWLTAPPGHGGAIPGGLTDDPSVGIVATGALTGSDVNPLVSALALVTLASWGALLVLRGRTRRAVAVLGVVATLGALAAWVSAYLGGPDTLELAGQVDVAGSRTAWPYATAAALVVTLLALAVAVRDAKGWPTMSSRYDAPVGDRSGASAARPDPDDDPRAVWRALDDGDDPTA